MKIKRLRKNSLMRAAMTLALIMACVTAWAGTVTVNIIGSGTVNVTYNGTTTEENINSGWNMTLSGSLTLIMIPAQGYTLQELQMVTNLGSSTESTIENNGVYTYTIENVSFYDITYTVVFSIPGVTTYTLTGDGMTFSVEGQTVTSAEEGQRVDITLPSPGNHSYWVVTSSDVAIQKDDANHFHFTMPAKSVIVNAQQYYQTACYVNDESTHGHVMVNGNNAGTENHYADETITLTPVADAGYEYLPGTLTATNINTNESINLTDNGDGTWSFTMPNSQVSVSATFSFDPAHITMSGNEYTIHTATGWNVFCDLLEGGESFSGKTVKLGADIEVSRMAGSGSGGNLTANDRPFCGTFDGQGNTLTFNYGSSGSPANEDNLAPFRYVNNATIEHLHVDGDIYTKHVHTAGIVGQAYGTSNITDCRSSVNIISSITGDGTHGGIIAVSWTGSTTNITGCLFDGSIQSASGYTTNQCGGFVGWRNGTINVSNSLLTANLSTIATPDGLGYPSATFVRNGATTITNCYYNEPFGTLQGTQAYSISGGNYVTVGNAGTASSSYAVSGLDFYSVGLKCGDVLYAAANDEVSLTLGCTAPSGYYCTGYTATAGSLNGTTLTMPNEDVTIVADLFYCPAPTLTLEDNSITAYGATVSWTGSSESYILEYAEGNSPSTWNTVSSAAESPYTFSDLTPGTTYSVRVTGNCVDVNSQPSDVVSFTTDCLDFIVVDAAHPFTEGFEGEDFPPHCWESIATDEHAWSRAFYDDNHFCAYSGYDGPIYLVMPDIQLPSNGNALLTFWSSYVFLNYYNQGKSSVVLRSGGTETELWAPDITGLYTYNWYETTIDLTAFMGQTISLAFKYEGNDAHGWYVDDVEVTATASIFTKDIEGYKNDESGWYLIASPLATNVAPTAVTNMTNETFDLYYFDQTGGTNDMEWKNWKKEGGDGYHFNLEAGKGYLYANSEDVTLVFTGTPFEGDGSVKLTCETTNADQNMWGWNLVGNPYAQTAIVDHDFYVMNLDGSEIIASDRNDFHVEPMEGIFVKAEEDGETMTFAPNGPSKGHIQKPEPEQIVINLSTLNAQRSTSIIDRAIVRFDESRQLPKFQIRENSTKIYIPQDGKDYAIVSVGRDAARHVSTVPVNFKAKENGTYTISVSPEGMEMAYLHLIDNLTGADVDLLQTPEYTFNAKTTDFENRFKLVFVASNCGDANGDNETFAFYFNGNWIIANEGEATLQVIDLNGRILNSETVNGSVSKAINAASGVYMIRLINGDDVKVQKIVVR